MLLTGSAPFIDDATGKAFARTFSISVLGEGWGVSDFLTNWYFKRDLFVGIPYMNSKNPTKKPKRCKENLTSLKIF